MASTDSRTVAHARLLARLALLCLLGSLVALLAVEGRGGLLVLALGAACAAVTAAGTWWALSHHGAMRVVGALLAVGAPVALVALYSWAGLWPGALTAVALWGVALTVAGSAVRVMRRPRGMRAGPSSPPEHPVLIMNPKAGGGKVGRFGLVEKAEALGARVVLLDTSTHEDVEAIARRAVADGADLLGVAGGDGTQALVAAVAAEHDLPFLVISAGTRNHFAMDLGLDREVPARCLDALSDGEELRVDLGMVAGRAFVNTVSFGVYAQIVQRPDYREAKAPTALDALPDLLLGYSGRPLDALAGGTRLEAQQALLISNNPYTVPQPAAAGGRRPRLDRGTLGVVGVRVRNAAQAAELVLRGAQGSALHVLTAPTVTVVADADSIPVAVDGEALSLPTPVTCSIRPRALRVLVPRHRPGSAATAPPPGWREILSLALHRSPSVASTPERADG
ncbi:diacylglycerol kinase family enzyme [Kitasatospora sp. MAP12-15]|uniref:diacylglycerol/lipid kinase family protein n=1 Tax=unclassified Kitasatospora TaxID=2633591 RepID=UPI002473A486|nr:diacylglycerol kinase family protein [Kitasatospora sp. MAP12-44]MDH6108255.1 diacylglycerol kinase family enzyme [Kitasatospora sp. MAP12-44]